MLADLLPPRSALFVPASNPKALAKISALGADMVIIELEDAVRPEDKDEARKVAVETLKGDFGTAIKAVRINAIGTQWYADDVAAMAGSSAQTVVVPKVESVDAIEELANLLGRPVLAMIETPKAIQHVAAIADARGVAGLIAGTNDIAHQMRLPSSPDRDGLQLALQSIVLAARAAEIWAFDGVYNALDDESGLDAECVQGRRWGFDGKTLIHPRQVMTANRCYKPSSAELEEAHALIAAAKSHAKENGQGIGALRFRDRMIEDMHIATARAILARAEANEPTP